MAPSAALGMPAPAAAAAATSSASSSSTSASAVAAPAAVPQPIAVSRSPDSVDNRYESLQCAAASSNCCYSSSLRKFSVDLPDPILEESDETGSESAIEPVTPVSGRQSQEFTALQPRDDQSFNPSPTATPTKATLLSARRPSSTLTSTPRPVSSLTARSGFSNLAPTVSNSSSADDDLITPRPTAQGAPAPSGFSRRSRSSASSFKRTMSNFFRRPNIQIDRDAPVFESGSPTPSESYLSRPPTHARPPTSSGRFSFTRSSNTTRSNSPPSPASPLEMAPTKRSSVHEEDLPSPADFKKKERASTGLSLRGRAVNFVGGVGRNPARPKPPPRRASSFDAGNRSPAPHGLSKGADEQTYPPERLPWALPPDVGTGVKARRMSLSLPDDFNIDVAELLSEFEYQSKLLGRHGKHLGKGAASKVSLMVRKGYPTELYAVKEFRGKSARESQAEYEKKIKSEYTIGKSLHHPNIVETVRLCTDHGRWNHVMEYCAEGDLFSLVQKGFLKGEGKLKDRLCLFKQLIQGVNYLHANGIAHRDIKLENLLLTRDSKLKIADFGVSEVFCGTHPGLRESGGHCGKNMGEVRLCSPGICGSEPYIAPEVLQKRDLYDARALDVWSSAIVMIYMTFGGAIWSRAEAGNVHYDKLVAGWDKWYKKHESGDAVITDSDYPKCYALDVAVNPPALRRVLLQMLNPDPSKRIGINEVINNRWMKNVECCQLESYDDPSQKIDATKKDYAGKNGTKKIFCHNHLPPKNHGTHSLGKIPN